MKKLSLDLEALAVETFATVPPRPAAEGGTVHGHAIKIVIGSDESCDDLCTGGTVYITCEITCHACVAPTGTCYGHTCFGESCGPATSCTVGGSF